MGATAFKGQRFDPAYLHPKSTEIARFRCFFLCSDIFLCRLKVAFLQSPQANDWELGVLYFEIVNPNSITNQQSLSFN